MLGTIASLGSAIISLTSPVSTKSSISFTTSFLNQAGALVNIYKDGTVQVNHGGTEMGQGLHTKILQVASTCLGINPEFIKVTAIIFIKCCFKTHCIENLKKSELYSQLFLILMHLLYFCILFKPL